MKNTFFLFILFIMPITSLFADYASGLDAYNNEDYATAFKEWEPLAEQGNVDAQYNLGIIYDTGQGVTQDYLKASKWYKAAAEQGHVGAQSNLGNLYLNGEGVPKDYMMAIKWLRLAAEKNDVDAEYSLGIMYARGLGVTEDEEAAAEWFKKAAAQGDYMAEHELYKVQHKFRYKLIKFLESSLILSFSPVAWALVIFVSIRSKDYWKAALAGVLAHIGFVAFIFTYPALIEGNENVKDFFDQFSVENTVFLLGVCILSGISISVVVKLILSLSRLLRTASVKVA